MRRLVLILLMALGLGVAPSPAATGPWETSLDAALARAKREGKPVLLMHLFGKLDDAFC